MSLLEGLDDTSCEVTQQHASGASEPGLLGHHDSCRFLILKTIGSGAQGEAHLVRDNQTGEKCVAKGFHKSEMSRTDLRYAFSEVRCMSLLAHPNIVKYITDFHTPDLLVMVMEYCGGGDLGKQIQVRRTSGQMFKEHEAVFMFLQLTLALDHVHNLRMLHRDVKSANIFLTADGIMKLGDFGYSKTYANTISNDVAATFCGTPSYLAPELWNGNRYSKKADVWSLGCVLYEMLCLEKPFTSPNMGELCTLVLKEDPPEPNAELYTPELREVLFAMLEKDPHKRPTIRQLFERYPYLTSMMDKLKKAICNNDMIGEAQREEILQCIERSLDALCRPTSPAQKAAEDTPLFEGHVDPMGDMTWEACTMVITDDALIIKRDSGTQDKYPLSHIQSACSIPNEEDSNGLCFGVFFNHGGTPLFMKSGAAEHTHLDLIHAALGV
eukprot:TRINITY_DN7674_c0_g4_i1.p2 TRINITY_DN7674_c0_g4~~TRINITY_DN7674_c0_g4_i1.p2  ORF type:complete len:440 (+),score=125.69 TRINITY_DN7674_c0_g4_i1:133-1452(+)